VREESDHGIKELHEARREVMTARTSREGKYLMASTPSGSEMLRDAAYIAVTSV
jgi:hypothetical protein